VVAAGEGSEEIFQVEWHHQRSAAAAWPSWRWAWPGRWHLPLDGCQQGGWLQHGWRRPQPPSRWRGWSWRLGGPPPGGGEGLFELCVCLLL
jgi:hypothetical protein